MRVNCFRLDQRCPRYEMFHPSHLFVGELSVTCRVHPVAERIRILLQTIHPGRAWIQDKVSSHSSSQNFLTFIDIFMYFLENKVYYPTLPIIFTEIRLYISKDRIMNIFAGYFHNGYPWQHCLDLGRRMIFFIRSTLLAWENPQVDYKDSEFIHGFKYALPFIKCSAWIRLRIQLWLRHLFRSWPW